MIEGRLSNLMASFILIPRYSPCSASNVVFTLLVFVCVLLSHGELKEQLIQIAERDQLIKLRNNYTIYYI